MALNLSEQERLIIASAATGVATALQKSIHNDLDGSIVDGVEIAMFAYAAASISKALYDRFDSLTFLACTAFTTYRWRCLIRNTRDIPDYLTGFSAIKRIDQEVHNWDIGSAVLLLGVVSMSSSAIGVAGDITIKIASSVLGVARDFTIEIASSVRAAVSRYGADNAGRLWQPLGAGDRVEVARER